MDLLIQSICILKIDKFITDSCDQTVYFFEQGAFPDGLSILYVELGEVVAGVKPGRETLEVRILAIKIGLALEEVIVADHIYKIAKDGPHKKLTLMEGISNLTYPYYLKLLIHRFTHILRRIFNNNSHITSP